MPCINDPGQELIISAINLGFAVIPIPGVSSITTAMSISGMIFDQWIFAGFFPKQKTKRMELLDSISNDQKVIVILESPHRLLSCLKFILDYIGDRNITVCREMTKLYEEYSYSDLKTLVANVNQKTLKGEFVIVLAKEGYKCE